MQLTYGEGHILLKHVCNDADSFFSLFSSDLHDNVTAVAPLVIEHNRNDEGILFPLFCVSLS